MVFNVGANGGAYTETTLAGGIQFNVITGASATNTITFQKHPSATSVTVTASNALTAGAFTDAVIKLVGSDYMVFDAIDVRENASNTTSVLASNNKTEFGYALLATSATDGCQNNIIRNCNINLGATAYQNMFGIYSACTHSPTAIATAQTATSAAGVNSSNTFTGNTIANVVNGIAILMPPTTAALGTINTSITNNNITITGATAGPSGFVNWPGTYRSSGIETRNATGMTITGNTIQQSGAITNQIWGIELSHSTTPAGVTYTHTISNNSLTLTQTGTVAIYGIDLSNVNNNNITTGTVIANSNTINLTITAAGSTGSVRGIDLGSTIGTSTANSNTVNITMTNSAASTSSINGVVAPGALTTGTAVSTANSNTVTIVMTQSTGAQSGAITGLVASSVAGTSTTISADANTIEIRQSGAGTYTGTTHFINAGSNCANLSLTNNICRTNTGALATTGITHGIVHSATFTSSVNITGNTVNITRNSAGTAIFIGIFSSGGTAITSNYNINNNTITMVAGGAITAEVSGIGSADGGSPIKVFQNNTITITSAGTTLYGIRNSAGTAHYRNNTISITSSNTTAAVTVQGLRFTTGTSPDISGNSIQASTTGTSTQANVVSGIFINGGTTPNVFNNKVYNISNSSSSTSAQANGIVANTVTTGATIYNNMISGLSAPNGTQTSAVLGVNLGVTGVTYTVYNNTIILGTPQGTAITGGTNFGAAGILYPNSGTGSLNLRNNIIYVNATPNGTGFVAALRRAAGTATTLPAKLCKHFQ